VPRPDRLYKALTCVVELNRRSNFPAVQFQGLSSTEFLRVLESCEFVAHLIRDLWAVGTYFHQGATEDEDRHSNTLLPKISMYPRTRGRTEGFFTPTLMMFCSDCSSSCFCKRTQVTKNLKIDEGVKEGVCFAKTNKHNQ
jgi:hypothetical protein